LKFPTIKNVTVIKVYSIKKFKKSLDILETILNKGPKTSLNWMIIPILAIMHIPKAAKRYWNGKSIFSIKLAVTLISYSLSVIPSSLVPILTLV